jgi:hypothetical protein
MTPVRLRVPTGFTVALLLWASPVSAGTVCDVVDTLSPFAMIATQKLRARVAAPLPATYCAFGLFYKGPICTQRAKLNGVGIEPFHLHDSFVVATKTTGTAISLVDSRKDECNPNSFSDDLITGGGLVKGEQGPYGPPVNVDTSGTDPRVSSCNQAFVDAVDLSNAIRAMPATQEFDTIKVPVNGTFTIDATGGGVIRIRNLKLERIRSYVYYGYAYPCLYSGEDPAVLEIIADEGDDVILDITGSMSIGACGILDLYTENFLINAAGKGKAMRMGADSFGDGNAINILAPERTLKIEGDRVGEGTFVGYLWGRKIVTRGYVEMDRPPCLP